MSPHPQPARPLNPPPPDTERLHHAEVIELRPRTDDRSPVRAPDPATEPLVDTVVLGRSIPYRSPATPAAATSTTAAGMPIVDNVGLHELLVGRRERHSSAPPPARVQHRPWMLSSILIAGGGILAVTIAGELGTVPLVATIALLATVVCGAVLVAAQVTQEVGRARRR